MCKQIRGILFTIEVSKLLDLVSCAWYNATVLGCLVQRWHTEPNIQEHFDGLLQSEQQLVSIQKRVYRQRKTASAIITNASPIIIHHITRPIHCYNQTY